MLPPSQSIITCPSCPVNVHHYHSCDGQTKAKEVTIAQCGICSAYEKVCGMKMQAGNEKTLQPIPEDKPLFTFTSVFGPPAPPGVGPISGTASPVVPPALNRDSPQRDMVMQVKRRRMPSTARKAAKRSRPVLKKEKKEPYTACMARASDDGYSSDDSFNSIV